MIQAYCSNEEFNCLELYDAFLKTETDLTGTIVMHHGRVKRPGKQVANFSYVDLKPLTTDGDARLLALAQKAAEQFQLNQVLVVHRLGRINACDTVLFAVVSGATRDRCFAACSWIVDEIKREEFIELIEQP